jgi:hypothetical protein
LVVVEVAVVQTDQLEPAEEPEELLWEQYW